MRSPRPTRASASEGASLIELIVVLAVGAVLLQGVAPSWVAWRQRQRLLGAAADLATRIEALRARASARGRNTGLEFATDGGLSWRDLEDGDGDGLKSADLRAGIDIVLGPNVAIGERFAGVAAGLPPGVPPISGRAPADGVAFGAVDRLSLAPDGSATAGTVYLQTGRGGAAAVRVYGPTGRVSVWEFAARSGRWKRRR